MDKQHRLGFCLVLLGVVTLAVSVSAEPKRSCAPGQRPSVEGCVEGSRHARIRTVEVKAVRTHSVPTPDSSLGVDPAQHKRLDLARKVLLIQELQQLERVLLATPKNAPDRPGIIRRLAEGYVELEAMAERERIEQEILAEAAQRANATPSTSAKDTELPRSTQAAPRPRLRATTTL